MWCVKGGTTEFESRAVISENGVFNNTFASHRKVGCDAFEDSFLGGRFEVDEVRAVGGASAGGTGVEDERC